MIKEYSTIEVYENYKCLVLGRHASLQEAQEEYESISDRYTKEGLKKTSCEIYQYEIGWELDEKCNDLLCFELGEAVHCQGTMQLPRDRNCSCHINPPCGECCSNKTECDTCYRECEGEELT